MSIYLGTLGRMVELKCPATQQLSSTDGYSFEETLEGRVKAQLRPIQRRMWSLGTSDATTPAQQSSLLGFANGEWGAGPFIFVSADAPVTNLLSPRAASGTATLGSEVAAGGPVHLGGDEWAGASLIRASPGDIFLGAELTPVLTGVVVTGSAWVMGASARVYLLWYNADGSYISSSMSNVTAGSGMSRLSVVGVPPAGAAACRLLASQAIQAARPAITWTESMFDWAAGEGCPKAVLHAVSKSLVMASRSPRGGRYASLSYTITEVG